MSNLKPVARHGDVQIFKVEGDSDIEANPKSQSSAILAYGEMTGHAHQLKGDLKVDAEVMEDGIYFEVESDEATLVHEEHDTITLEKGSYISIIQEEYDPVQETRKVMD